MTSTIWPQHPGPSPVSSETVLSRSSNASQISSPIQNQIDGLVSGFIHQATDWKMLAAMTVGGLAYRYGRMGVMSIGSGPITAMPLRIISTGLGLASEVTTFEFTHRTLHTLAGEHTGSPLQNPSRLWSWSGPGGWKEGWLTSLVTFGTLKGFGKLAQEQNLILRHGLQDAGMVLGHQLVYQAGIETKPEGSLAEQFVHAEATNLQLEAGMGLGHVLTGGKILAIERGLDLSLASQISPPSILQSHTPHLAIAGAGGEGNGSLPIDHIKVNLPLMMEGGERAEFAILPNEKWKEEILGHLRNETTPGLDLLLGLRQRFVELMRGAKIPKEIKSKLIKELVAVYRLLQQGEGEEGKTQEAWEKMQEVGSELNLEFEEWLTSENLLPTLFIEPPRLQMSSPKTSLEEPSQKFSSTGEPLEVIAQRQEGIVQALEELTQTFHGLRKEFTSEEREAYRDELRRLDRVRQFIEGQWKGDSANKDVRGGWSRESIEKAQLDLLGRIKTIRDGLKPPETGGAPGMPLRPWLLRDYQQEMISGVERDLQNKELPWLGLASPMQTGKSFLIGPLIEVLRQHYGVGARIIILTSAEIITDQVMGDLLQGFPSHQVGRYDGHTKDIRDITVASYRAIAWGNNINKHFSLDGRPVLLINDEAYSTQSNSFQKIYTHFGLAETVGKGRNAVLTPKQGNGRVIGLSGTGAGLEGYHTSGQFDLFTALQTGRIRHMELDQVLLKLSSEQREMAGENMIWWEPTLENAEALVEIYDQRMHGKFERTLTYVPTIRHAELFEQAMAEKYGEGYSSAYHSKMSDGDLKEALTHHETKGGNLTSVGMLNRGYRGTGVGAVFHTYCSDSSELVLQRTGRAWGVPEGEALPDLYVLEVAWNERDSFATVARLLGLIDPPRKRFSTRDLEKAVTAIHRRRQWEAEREEKIVIGEVTPLFRHVPLVEEWRMRFGDVVKTAGGIAAVAKQTGLAPEVIAGFALGSLPTHLADMLQLKNYFGGEEEATALWVRSWQQVVEDVLGGRERVDGSLEKKLIDWRDHKGETVERARSLDEILGRHFPKRRLLQPEKPEWVSLFLPEFREIVGGGIIEAELMEMFRKEVEGFAQHLRQTRPGYEKVFERLVLAKSPQKTAELAQELGVSRSRVGQIENVLKQEFLDGIKRNHPPTDDPLALPILYLDLSTRAHTALAQAGIRFIKDLIPLSESEFLKIKNVFYKSLKEVKEGLAKYGMRLKGQIDWNHPPTENPLELPVEYLDLSVRVANALKHHNIRNLGELCEFTAEEMLKWENFGRRSLREVKEGLAKYGLELRGQGKISDVQVSLGQTLFPEQTLPPELLNFSVASLDLSVRSANALERNNIKYVGELLEKSERELLKSKYFGRKSLHEIKEILREFVTEETVRRNSLRFDDNGSVFLKFLRRNKFVGHSSYVFGSDLKADVIDPRFEPFGRFLIGYDEGQGYYITAWPSSPYEVGYRDKKIRKWIWINEKRYFRAGEAMMLKLIKDSSVIKIETRAGEGPDELVLNFHFAK